MKMSKKKNKRKSPSYYYRQWGCKGVSKIPLSELLLVGSFKRRITDLSRNNSHLSIALQESLVESARLNNLLKNYAKDYNQILFARIKLNEMARNLAKFATDLEEVRNCLAVELPAEYNFFQKKGLSNERIAKVPDVSCIDEVPELSKDEVQVCENADHSNLVENTTPDDHDVHMTPVLDDDVQGMQKKSSNAVYKESLTPQLNIDLAFKPKRSTRSRGKSSFGKKHSSGRLVTQISPVSSSLLPQVEDSIETNRVASKELLSACDIEKIFEDVEVPFQNHSTNFIDCIKDCSVILSPNLKDDLNQSSEVKEKVCLFQPLDDEFNSSFVVNLENKLEIPKCIKEISENCDELCPDENKLSVERNSRKLPGISQNISLHSEVHEYDEEIKNVGSLTFCESDDEGEERNTISSMIRTSRSRKPLSYADYFSSDESDADSPFRLAVTKRKSSKKIIIKNSVSDDNSCEKTIAKNAVEISSDIAVTEIFEPDYSVYNLDVSDSKEKLRKSKKKKISIKSKSKKTRILPKPLFQKCSVIKLKGGEHKFSKCETPLELKSIGKHTQKLLQNSCASPSSILKKPPSSISKTSDDKRTSPNDTGDIDDMQNPKQHSMLQTPKRVSFAPTDLVCNFEKMSVSKTIAGNKKVRRTSKSAADLTKLFDEDQSKTSPIGMELFDENQSKISPISTELFDENQSKISPISTELFDEDQSKTSHTNTDIPPRKKDAQNSNNPILFDFSADTEVYTLTFPLNAQSLPADNASSKPSSSLVYEPTKRTSNRNEMCTKKSPEMLPKSPKSIKKLSLKENKVARNSVSECSLDEAEIKAAILFMESPMSLLKNPKRKSLFKESPAVDLKENLNFEHPVSEKDSLANKIHRNKNSSSSTLTVGIEKSSNSKCQITVRSNSTKKNKKKNVEKKSLEEPPILIDTTNVLASAGDNYPRRRSKQVSYREPSLNKKLRRQ